MTLIPDWRHAWRFHTVIGAAALAAFNVIAANADAVVQLASRPEVAAALTQALSPATLAKVNTYGALALLVLRLVKQQIPARAAPPPPAESPAKPTDGVSQ